MSGIPTGGGGELGAVLVVDDHPATRYSTARTLRAAGFGTVEASTGGEALARAGSELAAVVLDVNLPDIDGMEVCRILRERVDTARVPIVHLSATYTDDQDKVRGLESGADAYITHPAEPRLLVATLRALIRARTAEDQVRLGERRFRQLADAMPQIVWVTGPQGQPEYVNERWQEYTGRSLDGLDGTTSHPDDSAEATRRWREALFRGEPYSMECRLAGADGQYRWFLVRALPVRDEDGRVTRWFGTCTDIDDQKRNEAELARLLGEEQRGADLLRRVAAVSQLANQGLAAEAIAQLFADELLSLLGARVGAVLTSAGGSDWRAALVRSASTTPEAGAAEALRAMASRIIESVDRPLRLDAEALRSHPLLGALPAPLEGAIAAPLRGRSEHAMGVIVALDKAGGFGVADELVLTQMAAIAATGIENAWLYESLRREARQKDEFLATLAHELRNPLAPMRTGLSILERTFTDDVRGVAPTIRMMSRQLGLMVRLIDDLLDVSRVTSGKIELRIETVDVRTIVDGAIETSRPAIEAGGHALSVSIPDRPLPVLGDRTRLAQVLSNLLQNAAKYTDAGGRIELGVAVEGASVVVEVRDNGVGIDREMLALVWDMFAQAGTTLERAQGGLGIGLTLVRRLVEMHGGTVAVVSAGRGRGSTFTVRLPLASTAPAQPATAARAAPAADAGTARRVLIVDDNVDAAESLAALLALAGHDTFVAHDAPSALEAARARRPDVAFLDIGLPGVNGYELAALLRAQSGSEDIRMVALTGWGTEADRRRSSAAGFDHHLVKPVEPADLLRAIERGADSAA